jgi:proteasome lid subunit RPN8/RPN11
MRISAELRERMRALGEAAYPNEGCGIFLGVTGGEAEVREVRLATNLREDRARDRYVMDPRDILKAERDAEALGLEVVGFWHTHPDHPARPSQYDADHAWGDYVYVIMAIHGGVQVDVTGWVLESESPPVFREESLTS